MTELRYPRRMNEEEIDLIELFQKIWAQRWLIFAVTSVVLILTVAYILISKPAYSASIVIAPAPVNVFGSIAGDIGVEQLKFSKSVISFGTDLANDTFSLVVKNVESTSVLDGFNRSLDRSGNYIVQIKKDNFTYQSVSISVVSDSAEGAKNYLDSYMVYVSEISAAQLNEYFKALQVSHAISPDSLYSVEKFSELPTQPIKPKKLPIMLLGLMLGVILGIFSALIRLALIKRSTAIA